MMTKRFLVIFGTLIAGFGLQASELHSDFTSWGFSDRQGKRPSMEDRYTVQSLDLTEDKKVQYFGVFDGHAGDHAAQYAADTAVKYFKQAYDDALSSELKDDAAAKQAFLGSFLKIDKEIRDKHETGGTTAVAAVLDNDRAYIGWVGDSRALVISKDAEIKAATEDHKPGKFSEVQRIGDPRKIQRMRLFSGPGFGFYTDHVYFGEQKKEKKGFRPRKMGPWRIADLAMSRVLGDAKAKKKEPKIIASAEMITADLKPGDTVVLASDGLWDVMSNKAVADYVADLMDWDEAKLNDLYGDEKASKKELAEEAGDDKKAMLIARALRNTAFKKDSKDNISVLIIRIP